MNWVETTQGIITLVSTGVALLGLIISLVVKIVNSVKEIVKNKNWNKITSIALSAILAAEKSGKSGSDKKKMVIDSVQASCKAIGIDCDLSALNTYIDSCIDFANNLHKK